MNAKNCKAARRLARQLSSGMPERQLLGHNRKVKRKRGPRVIEYQATQAINDPKSTRGVYRAIKNALRRGVSLALMAQQRESKPASPT
jgi:hypothetical protein